MKRATLFCFCLYFIVMSAHAQRPPAIAVATAHPLATEAGIHILQQGGNAFDAAVAVSAVLAVVEPYASGMGGGGFWLLHFADSRQPVVIDGREKAPMTATRNLYLDAQGKVKPKLSREGGLAAGIPGQPAALVHIAKKYGVLPLSKTLAPAISLARHGFQVDSKLHESIADHIELLRQFSATADTFLIKGRVPKLKDKITQSDLANTLEKIAQHGKAGFYAGSVAQRLVDGVRQHGGIWQLQDLYHYQIVERAPIIGHFHGMTVLSAPPPSSGGIVLVEMLNIIKQWYWADTHLMVEAMRRAYRDRALYLGDSDFVDIPVQRLLSDDYAAGLAASIQLHRATPSDRLPAVPQEKKKGQDTTHFSILDQAGNAVSATLSINTRFGSGVTPAGTGILLNNEMDDFSIQPGHPNVYGLVGGEANAIAPGKRMLSSMSPTIVFSKDRVAILGTPGGSRIISMLLLAIIEHDRAKQPLDWVSRPRFHHQYLPDEIQIEPDAFTQKELDALIAQGHKIKLLKYRYGNMQAILWDKKRQKVSAASDPRGIGKSMVISK